jgi:hypothetical protein
MWQPSPRLEFFYKSSPRQSEAEASYLVYSPSAPLNDGYRTGMERDSDDNAITVDANESKAASPIRCVSSS